MKKVALIPVFVLLLLAAWLTNEVKANGLVISNTSLTGQNTGADTWQVRFNITWDNSWRDNNNWDAVWIFCKFRVGTNAWAHATLSNTGFQTGNGTPITINVSCDQKGAFISRRDAGSGTLTATQVELRWNYGTDGVLDANVPDLNIYGIEMVFIPTSPFTIGDGNGVNSSSTGSFYAVSQHLPYTIDNLMSPNISAGSNFTNASSTPANFIRIDGDGGLDINLDGTVDSASFPTGYNAFYMMKYEVTQGQYTDFLNLLTYTQQTARVNNSTNVVGQSIIDASVGVNPSRNTIIVQTAGTSPSTPRVYATSRPDRANTHMNAPDMMAYLDWVALRPITELEFEKACRGPLAPVNGEYAWGSTSNNIQSSITLSGTENGTETVTSPVGLNGVSNSPTVSQGDGGSGFVRVGITATSSTVSKYASGASYYGVMNMSDHAHEVVVTLGNVAGRSYRGDHGNGNLLANGNADVPFWPGANGNTSVTTANVAVNSPTGCSGWAGLGYKNATTNVSQRSNIVTASTSRTGTPHVNGSARGGRTAFSAEFLAIMNNGTYALPNQSVVFNTGSSASTYSWSFTSGSPSTSNSATPSVTWSSPGTYNVSLTATQGSCSSTALSVIEVIPACSSPAVLSGTQTWTQNNTTYNNANGNNPRSMFDGNLGSSFSNTVCCTNGTPIWAIIDFGAATSLNGIGFYNYVNNTTWAVTDYILEGSSSISGPWTPVGSGMLPVITVASWQDYLFTPASYRYWKLTMINNTGPYIQMYEVRFNRCN